MVRIQYSMTTKDMQSLRAKGWTYQRIAVKAGVTRLTVWRRFNPMYVLAYRQTPKYKAYHKAYMKAYQQKPKIKARHKAYQKAYYHNIIKPALAEYRQRHGKE